MRFRIFIFLFFLFIIGTFADASDYRIYPGLDRLVNGSSKGVFADYVTYDSKKYVIVDQQNNKLAEQLIKLQAMKIKSIDMAVRDGYNKYIEYIDKNFQDVFDPVTALIYLVNPTNNSNTVSVNTEKTAIKIFIDTVITSVLTKGVCSNIIQGAKTFEASAIDMVLSDTVITEAIRKQINDNIDHTEGINKQIYKIELNLLNGVSKNNTIKFLVSNLTSLTLEAGGTAIEKTLCENPEAGMDLVGKAFFVLSMLNTSSNIAKELYISYEQEKSLEATDFNELVADFLLYFADNDYSLYNVNKKLNKSLGNNDNDFFSLVLNEYNNNVELATGQTKYYEITFANLYNLKSYSGSGNSFYNIFFKFLYLKNKRLKNYFLDYNNHNKYDETIMKKFFEASEYALNIINTYSSVGNSAVSINVSNIGNIKDINYHLFKSYWTPKVKDVDFLTIGRDVDVSNMDMTESFTIPNWINVLTLSPVFLIKNMEKYYNDFSFYHIPLGFVHPFVNVKYGYQTILSERDYKKHINLDYKSSIVDKDGTKYLLIKDAKLTINYNGIIKDNQSEDLQSLDKDVKYLGNFAIPLPIKNLDLILSQYGGPYKKAFLDFYKNEIFFNNDNPKLFFNDKYLSNPEILQLFKYLYLNEKINITGLNKLKKYLKNRKKWIITESDFIHFLYMVLPPNHILYKASNIISKHKSNYIKKFHLSTNWSINACALNYFGLLHGVKQNGKFYINLERSLSRAEMINILYKFNRKFSQGSSK